MNAHITKIDRRNFLKQSSVAGAGLILAAYLPGCAKPSDAYSGAKFSPNVFLTLDGTGKVTIIAHRSEMGQGIRTSLPAVVADELGADWARVTVQQAEGDEDKYGDQNTDGSYSMRMFFEPMKKVGATARMMLEKAAADQWKVKAEECKAQNHTVVHEPSGKSLGFGELVEAASKLPVPEESALVFKNKSQYQHIGKNTAIVDLPDLVQGKAVFGLDADIPGAKVAVIRRCPVAGGKVVGFNDEKTRQVPGVINVFTLDSPGFPTGFANPLGGVVVVADHTWAALKGRDALEVEWDFGPNASYNTAAYMAELETKTAKDGKVRRAGGNVKQAQKEADLTLEAVYKIPHIAHATMEPPCGTARFENGKCEVWIPAQSPQWARNEIAKALELKEEEVTVNVTLLGGGFGRKSKPDFMVEAAKIAKMQGGAVKLVWTREDDIQHDLLHACSVQRIKVTLNDNKVTGWQQRSAFPPIGGTDDATKLHPDGGEVSLGLIDFPWDVPNISLETHEAKAMTRIGWLRSVANIQHAFAIGSMLDEVAHARKLDPVQNLLDLLGSDRQIDMKALSEEFGNYGTELADYPWDTGRFRKTIELVAEKSGWGKPLPKNQARGICAHRSFLTYVACVVTVEVDDNGKLVKIPEIHYGVDCGLAVNVDRVKSQFEGGAVFALSAALKSQVTFENGRTVQSNFDGFEIARMSDAPDQVFVHFVESNEKPTGVGEPPVPPVAPALANAYFAATGKRLREMPLRV